MNNTIKQKYSPCELSVVEFKVERGFAASGGEIESPSTSMVGAFANAQYNWTMTKESTQQHFQNEQMGEVTGVNWFN